ncbi:hypothetical protein LWI28_003546 [Acer negundo]|uniref:Uncharacterized protein n=1 Tax=Acer negundo TaxID=4023 RepID=A0AAD5IKE8_ACENE|nr:hypothetical protein LWI28_003546 [Acer negundo]
MLVPHEKVSLKMIKVLVGDKNLLDRECKDSAPVDYNWMVNVLGFKISWPMEGLNSLQFSDYVDLSSLKDAYKLHYLDSEIKGSSLEEGNGSDQDYNNEKKVQKGQQVNVLTKKSSGLANGRDVEGKSVVEDGKVCIQAYNKELKGSKRTLDLNSRKESRLLCPLSCAKKERLLGHDLAWVEFGSHSPSKGSIVKAAVGVFDGKFFFYKVNVVLQVGN